MFDVIALLITGAAGMLGWYCAWAARGEALAARTAIATAVAGETAAQELAAEAKAQAATAGIQAQAATARADQLQGQLDAERAGRQALIDAMAKSGVPVAPLVVGSVLDGLYGGATADRPGADPNTGPGGPLVPGGDPVVARTTTRR